MPSGKANWVGRHWLYFPSPTGLIHIIMCYIVTIITHNVRNFLPCGPALYLSLILYVYKALLFLAPALTDVRWTSIMNNSESASVTIEWDPPSQGGSRLNYTITTTPDLISGPPPVTTSTSTTITINYNTDYTITVTASNRCVGNGIPSDVLSVNIGELLLVYS